VEGVASIVSVIAIAVALCLLVFVAVTDVWQYLRRRRAAQEVPDWANEERHCSRCGALMIVSLWRPEYDTDEGTLLGGYLHRTCPHHRGWDYLVFNHDATCVFVHAPDATCVFVHVPDDTDETDADCAGTLVGAFGDILRSVTEGIDRLFGTPAHMADGTEVHVTPTPGGGTTTIPGYALSPDVLEFSRVDGFSLDSEGGWGMATVALSDDETAYVIAPLAWVAGGEDMAGE